MNYVDYTLLRRVYQGNHRIDQWLLSLPLPLLKPLGVCFLLVGFNLIFSGLKISYSILKSMFYSESKVHSI